MGGMSTWAIVVAAGSGQRFGGSVPKQFLPLGDRRVLDWSVAGAHEATDGVVLVVGADHDLAAAVPLADTVVAGGAERSDSVRAGLAALPADCDVVVVHDGARPLASPALYAAVIEAVRGGADGAIPGLPVTDTIKEVRDGAVVGTPDRANLVAVQTPQAFRTDQLRRAHAGGGSATDDAALVERAGGRVVVVPGEADNLKITQPADLAAAEAALARRPG